MENIKDLERKYVEKFGDMFPNIGISEEYEREIILESLAQAKDAYELGFFNLEDCY